MQEDPSKIAKFYKRVPTEQHFQQAHYFTSTDPPLSCRLRSEAETLSETL